MLRNLIALVLLAGVVSKVNGATLPAFEDTSSLKGKLTLAMNKGGTLPVDGNRRAFVYFELGEVPAGAQLRYARLRLYSPTVARAGAGLTLHAVTAPWSESLAGVEPARGSAIGNFAAAEIGAKRFISVDVTATVNGWLANPGSNEGFAVAAVPGSSSRDTALLTIGAKEGSGTGSFYGAADMAGNVAEWNETAGSGDLRSVRGGAWNDPEAPLRSESRAWLAASGAEVTVGFRVAGK